MRQLKNLYSKPKKVRKISKARKKSVGGGTGSIKGKKLTGNKTRYKEGWHTTWDKKKVYLRSGAEFNYARQLDKEKVEYEVESMSIYYFDSKLKKVRKGYPDFFIPSRNLVVEIKGGHLLNLQNLKDRQKAINDKGYLFEVIVDGRKLTLS